MNQNTLDEGRIEAIHGFDIPGIFRECDVCGNGHINDTYMMTFEQNGVLQRYSLQHMNRGVSDFLKWPAFDLTDCPSIAHFSVRQRFNDTGADAPVQSNHFSR